VLFALGEGMNVGGAARPVFNCQNESIAIPEYREAYRPSILVQQT